MDTIRRGIFSTGCCILSENRHLSLLCGEDSPSEIKLFRLRRFAQQHAWKVVVRHHGRVAVFRPDDSLPDSERRARTPNNVAFGPDGHATVERGGAILHRGEHCAPHAPCVDLSRLPVPFVSHQDAEAYAKWAATSGVRGARLCTDAEWERAARGADDRTYVGGFSWPGGDEVCDNLQNDGLSCDVEAHSASRSVFGALDMCGNVWEWTASPADAAEPHTVVARGASSQEGGIYLLLANRSLWGDSERYGMIGIRLCADAP